MQYHVSYATPFFSILCLHLIIRRPSSFHSVLDVMDGERPVKFVRLQVVPHEDTDDATPTVAAPPSTPSSEIDTSISNVMIPLIEWNDWLQDRGCSIHHLPKPTYKQSKIPPYGPKEKSLYYYHLTSIAIDYIKNFKKEKDLDRGWNKVRFYITLTDIISFC